jgi:hypothetical protein
MSKCSAKTAYSVFDPDLDDPVPKWLILALGRRAR